MTVQGSRSFVTISLVGFAAGLVVAFALGAGFGATVVAQSGHTGLYGGARPLAPYSPGVDSGDTVYLSGQVGINPETGSLHDGVAAQARQALSNLENLLDEAGLTKANVTRATVYLDDIDNYGALNEVYGEFFEGVDVKPSRSTVGVAALPIGAAVEIDFIAVR
ncbi:MAG: Rid family detoxifying hydrolase [Vicinamibacterales bacterium]|jgi:2-iminobutanoate/2-iminopropanoate deaminase|nr:hypothetical protein [Acidobacteriota bacterium]MDP6373191.1 Rid family detoxifying hydrolase [Vicinamibacterales bacterium]MDP6607495.1 Rid family detoxifying hydrolase [Vicinamibacterales bacterium]HAK56306.1 hypothetical protein [Acidobacteriota bacterium]|tara:strand:+ start:3513 stop:4004 length:492 start_codon:yes stop_codon:yes gene_type:complete